MNVPKGTDNWGKKKKKEKNTPNNNNNNKNNNDHDNQKKFELGISWLRAQGLIQRAVTANVSVKKENILSYLDTAHSIMRECLMPRSHFPVAWGKCHKIEWAVFITWHLRRN